MNWYSLLFRSPFGLKVYSEKIRDIFFSFKDGPLLTRETKIIFDRDSSSESIQSCKIVIVVLLFMF